MPLPSEWPRPQPGSGSAFLAAPSKLPPFQQEAKTTTMCWRQRAEISTFSLVIDHVKLHHSQSRKKYIYLCQKIIKLWNILYHVCFTYSCDEKKRHFSVKWGKFSHRLHHVKCHSCLTDDSWKLTGVVYNTWTGQIWAKCEHDHHLFFTFKVTWGKFSLRVLNHLSHAGLTISFHSRHSRPHVDKLK